MYNDIFRDISLVVLGVARNKTPGATLHMMVNMPVKVQSHYVQRMASAYASV